ncbi:sialate O-acetylesterase [Akkermansiaceae bacterium]|nr:sialate O-acetylesterase [Akkermansiaceae bacterium]MDB2428561.1 sialate O-acetylesterase [Akkermansiaceae bacterium]MDB4576609.1 sialate O-acetylesterase [Akkermansiaceae bacterium]MDB4759470.1 sialate O-acetylesterase [Akkermansiaceae bacterium]
MKKLTLLILACGLSSGLNAEDKKLKVYILAGQSNMQGHCTTSVIENRLKDLKLRVGFEKYHQGGSFVKREDVFINHIEKQMHGPMSVGYGASNDKIGPELSFGWTIGDKLDEEVLIIKAAWGGKSLFRDFLPPSGRKPDEAFIQALEDKAKKKKKPFSKEEYMEGFGHYYRLMMTSVGETLGDLKTYAPNYKGQGYEIAGFVWFQGFNDKFSDHSTSTYQENMAHFIRDVRKDLKSPKLPFVIGAMGHQGTEQKGTTKILADAQIATAQMPEFKGNVITVKTADFWDYDAGNAFENKNRDPDTWAKLGSNRAYHYFGSAAFFEKTGTAFAEAVIELEK